MTLMTYNQLPVPAFMYGTAWKKDATKRLVELAVDSGFTAIDTANQLRHYYEIGVGEALLELARRGIKRDSLFLQTKFTSLDGQGDHTPYDPQANLTTQVNQSIDSSLQHLHTDVLDSYVLHGPYTRYGLSDSDWEVWAAIEDQFQKGKTKSIGVSNVTAEQLAILVSKAKVKPMFCQNRCYAVRGWDSQVRKICLAENIIYQGFSLLTANTREMFDPSVRAIAQRLGTGVEQVIFRFAMQIGMLPLTGTSDARHMKEDLSSETLTLSDDDMKLIENIGV
ncbi:MAG: aldo/keto reductase [Candidatus Obscuribacterales bacterium]|nr:aldo/keto reductase [Candidatus Obscuribacterales bacterium]